jgi:hypothetical protein
MDQHLGASLLAGLALCLGLFSITALTGCSELGPSTHFAPSKAELSSKDATVQAQAYLELYFNALAAGNDAAADSYSVPGHGPGGRSGTVRRIVVDSIKPLPVNGDSPDREFVAPVHIWPGDGSIPPGGVMGPTWTMQRGGDGRWRVLDWGSG